MRLVARHVVQGPQPERNATIGRDGAGTRVAQPRCGLGNVEGLGLLSLRHIRDQMMWGHPQKHD
jgi:hypothetical protein